MHTNVDVRAAFLGQGLGNTKKPVGNNMNKVTEIYQENCFTVARKSLYEKTFFRTNTFDLPIKSNIAGKKFLRNNFFSPRKMNSESFAVYWKLF